MISELTRAIILDCIGDEWMGVDVLLRDKAPEISWLPILEELQAMHDRGLIEIDDTKTVLEFWRVRKSPTAKNYREP